MLFWRSKNNQWIGGFQAGFKTGFDQAFQIAYDQIKKAQRINIEKIREDAINETLNNIHRSEVRANDD